MTKPVMNIRARPQDGCHFKIRVLVSRDVWWRHQSFQTNTSETPRRDWLRCVKTKRASYSVWSASRGQMGLPPDGFDSGPSSMKRDEGVDVSQIDVFWRHRQTPGAKLIFRVAIPSRELRTRSIRHIDHQ